MTQHSARVIPMDRGDQRLPDLYYYACDCGVCGKVRGREGVAYDDLESHLLAAATMESNA